MPYIDGFVIAVPTVNKAAFKAHAQLADPVFMEMGALHIVEAWEDDVKDGKVTDFWITWPDKATRDAAMSKLMSGGMNDPRMDPAINPMPFDGKRMIFGGFVPVVEFGGAPPSNGRAT